MIITYLNLLALLFVETCDAYSFTEVTELEYSVVGAWNTYGPWEHKSRIFNFIHCKPKLYILHD